MEAPRPSFPPLFRGAPEPAPFRAAVAAARAGADPGLVTWHAAPERLATAVVLAPEVPLRRAMAGLLAAGNGFADAFGALAPAEVAFQFDWPAGFLVNGGRCGGLRAAAPSREPGAEPDWLVIGLDVARAAPPGREPGETPDRTTLAEEGCGGIDALDLLEAWTRHMLARLHDWETDGIGRLHRDWTGRCPALGREVAFDLAGAHHAGVFLGLDEDGGMLLRAGGETRLLPLTLILEEAP